MKRATLRHLRIISVKNTKEDALNYPSEPELYKVYALLSSFGGITKALDSTMGHGPHIKFKEFSGSF